MTVDNAVPVMNLSVSEIRETLHITSRRINPLKG